MVKRKCNGNSEGRGVQKEAISGVGGKCLIESFFRFFFPSFKTITIIFIIYDWLNAFLHGFAIDSCHRLVYLAVAVLHNIIIVVFIVMLLGSRKDK